jgi:hypothetical protein
MGGGTGGTQLPPCGRALILGVYPPLGLTLKNKSKPPSKPQQKKRNPKKRQPKKKTPPI